MILRELGFVVLLALAAMAMPGCAPKAVAPADPGVLGALMQPPPAEASQNYRIQIGDELHIRFTYQPEMNEQLPVRPDGRISLATTGEIAVVGMTPSELEALIVERSSTRLRDPEVRVIVTKVGEQRVYVGGEVQRPGYVLLQPNMTPVQAVMQSGGFRMTAKPESTLLLSPHRDGEFTAARLNLKQVVEEGVPERVRLAAGDVLYVPSSWIGDANQVVDLYVRGLIPVLPRVGVGYSLGQNN
ncbi:MAG TPA: polysaccharide biosynthesis/export family protein [Candidatus Limnocylindria bacterium]|nr:polysaccharide biosynthesis/export family protein [Candidatus Limnocylindria bacterium]